MTQAAARTRPGAGGLRVALADPHVVLALGAALALAAEAGYRAATSDAWLLAEAAVAALALLRAWQLQGRLRLWPLLALAFALQAGFVAVHLGFGYDGDHDASTLFHRQGEALLHGRYPHSEYPVGAVLLFALEALVSGGHTRVANAFAMIPSQLAIVAALWATRSRLAPWLAAVVALWPLDAFLWEFKFDLAPTALLVVGLVLALRGRWTLSGIALAAGALLKWTPGLAFIALAASLVGARRLREARAHTLAFVATVAIPYVPFLAWSADGVLAAYRRQGGRTITPESLWYLPLHPLGLAHVRTHISYSAGAPGWADALAIAIQALLVLAVVAAAFRARGRSAVALAALAPVVFVLTNRIFSPQFLLTVLGGWALAGALVARSRREQLAIGLAAAGAATANAFVYPFALPHYAVTWQLASLVLFVLALGVTAWLAAQARAAT